MPSDALRQLVCDEVRGTLTSDCHDDTSCIRSCMLTMMVWIFQQVHEQRVGGSCLNGLICFRCLWLKSRVQYSVHIIISFSQLRRWPRLTCAAFAKYRYSLSAGCACCLSVSSAECNVFRVCSYQTWSRPRPQILACHSLCPTSVP